jgi:predicted esterase
VRLLAACLVLVAGPCLALTEAREPDWRCDNTRGLISGFEATDTLPPERPSFGSGGEAFANVTIASSAAGNVQYHAQPPPDYAGEALPLIIALHGAGGPGTQFGAANTLRFYFSEMFPYAIRFLIAAPQSSGSQGGWVLPDDTVKIRAVVADMISRYNVDQNRVYGWGYSAGGLVLHSMALSDASFVSAYTGHATRLPQIGTGNGVPETAARKVPVLLTHGLNDSVVPYSTALADRTRFINAGWLEQNAITPGNFTLTAFNVDHIYNDAIVRAAWDWMCPRVLLP